MKIFIYGGTGYLGTSIISGLSDKYKFYITSRKKKKNFKNVKILNEKKDKTKILLSLRKSDLIIISNGPSYKDSKKKLFSYIKYLNDQIDIIIKSKKKTAKVVYFSTIHVYENYHLHKASTTDLLLAKTDYAIRNIICENLLLSKFKKNEINILRMSNIFGIQKRITKLSKNMFNLAINQFCLKILKNQKILIRSNPNEKRNFISINDFVNFIDKAFLLKRIKFNQVINYASKNEISLKSLISILKDESKKYITKKPKIKFQNKINNSKINYKFNLKDIKNCNLLPKITINDEINMTLDKIQSLL